LYDLEGRPHRRSPVLSNSTPSLHRPDLPRQFYEGLTPEQRRTVARCLWTIGVLGAATLIGVGSSLYLVNSYPLLLIALSPLGRHLILVAPIVNPYAFVAVAVGRRAAFSVPFFYIGRALGPIAVQWLELRSPRAGQAVRWLERLFRRFEKASFAVVFFLPGPAISTIAGDSGMRSVVYLSMLVAGLVFRMLITLWIGDWLRGPIEILVGWIDQYRVPGTVVLVAGIAFYQWRQR
jgi:membrane protein DedA with SNARE-associated domain